MEDDDILEQIATVPIDQILDGIAFADRKPILEIGLAQVRAAEAAPRLLAVLSAAADGLYLGPEAENLLFYGLHILAGARNRNAFAPLMRLLRLPVEKLERLLGDAITESLPKIVAGVFDGHASVLLAAIADETIYAFTRSSLIGALTFLTWDGRIDAAETRRFLERFDDDRLGDLNDEAGATWDAWQTAIALLGWGDLTPRVEAAFKDERILPEITSFDYYLEDLARAEAEPRDPQRFHDAHLGYIEDTLEALEWVADSDSKTGADRYEPSSHGYTPMIPAINPLRHIGRNAPCPCGSGKKFKKCCLADV
jgi:hypothetical protein